MGGQPQRRLRAESDGEAKAPPFSRTEACGREALMSHPARLRQVCWRGGWICSGWHGAACMGSRGEA
eukprot:4092155-Alexandrium_andersonii.AAC.1